MNNKGGFKTKVRGLLDLDYWDNEAKSPRELIKCSEAHARNPNREQRTYSHGPYGILSKTE